MNPKKAKKRLRATFPTFIRRMPKQQALNLLEIMRRISSPIGQEVIDEEIERIKAEVRP